MKDNKSYSFRQMSFQTEQEYIINNFHVRFEGIVIRNDVCTSSGVTRAKQGMYYFIVIGKCANVRFSSHANQCEDTRFDYRKINFCFSNGETYSGTLIENGHDTITYWSGTNSYDYLWGENKTVTSHFEIIVEVPKRTVVLSNMVSIEFGLINTNSILNIKASDTEWKPDADTNLYLHDIVSYASSAIDQEQYIIGATLFKKASLLGSAEAQYALAEMYQTGLGIEENETMAYNLFCLASKQNYDKSYIRLAECCYYGYGTEKNNEQALYWLKRSYSTDKNKKTAICHFEVWFPNKHFDLSKIRELCTELCKKNVNYADFRPKLINMLGLSSKKVYLAFDSTMFSSAKEGFAIAEDGFYYRKNSKKEELYLHVSFYNLALAYITGDISQDNYHIVLKGVSFYAYKQNEVFNLLQNISNTICD